jgi:hypothetical protein
VEKRIANSIRSLAEPGARAPGNAGSDKPRLLTRFPDATLAKAAPVLGGGSESRGDQPAGRSQLDDQTILLVRAGDAAGG